MKSQIILTRLLGVLVAALYLFTGLELAVF